ncbi:MAG: DNA/RNA non-specific endonuclease [Flavobacteriales bacterium]|nr:DNA/RNA non-specific endonuclease [Flavobacteriales bacterium]
MMLRSALLLPACSFFLLAFSQTTPEKQLQELQVRYDQLEEQQNLLLGPIEDAKLSIMQRDLAAQGLPALAPGDVVTVHPGHSLVWNEKYHTPKWTAHVVMPDIMKGNLARIDSFMPDPLVQGNTDLFDEYWYSGYDRGHMVPSADMRWSQKALAATYLYSNISPQKPEMNRETWADLEDWGRRYVHYSKERVFIVTGPVQADGQPTLSTPKTKEAVSIPSYCFKAFADLDGPEKKGIAFVMNNGPADKSMISYAVSIDSVEKITGLDLFPMLDDSTENAIEAMTEVADWYAKGDPTAGEVAPLKAPLPGGRFNTTQAKYHIGHTATICGTVVSSRRTTKANAVYLNMDRNHPNQEFYATVWDSNGPNFHYDPVTYLVNKKVCITGKVTIYNDIPRISVNNENEIEMWDEVVK